MIFIFPFWCSLTSSELSTSPSRASHILLFSSSSPFLCLLFISSFTFCPFYRCVWFPGRKMKEDDDDGDAAGKKKWWSPFSMGRS